MPTPLLALDGLGKDFGGQRAVEALTAVVHGGEIVGLLGPNGAGKTTTMRLLLGLLRPTRGGARVDGLDVTADALAVKAKVGYSPDEPAFYDFLTGRETVEFALRMRGLEVGAFLRDAEALARDLELADVLDAPVGTYSHGTKKKLALLLALVHGPKVLLLDEPTNGLDPPTAVRVRALLEARARDGAAVVVSTHHLDLAERLCGRVLVLHGGRLIAEGTPAEVRARSGAGESASLEDAFLQMVREG